MEATMSDAFKAVTEDCSDDDFLKHPELLEVLEKLKERAEYVVTNDTRRKLEKAKADALAAQERHLQALVLKNAWTNIGISLCSKEDLEPCVEGATKDFIEQFEGLKYQVLIAESPFGSVLNIQNQPEVTQELKAEVHIQLAEELLKQKSKLLNQMGDFKCSSLQESVLSKCTDRDIKKRSVFNLVLEYADCASEFKKAYEQYLTLVSSMPVLDEKEHDLLKICEEVYENYFLANDGIEEEVESCIQHNVNHLFKEAEKRLLCEVEQKRATVQQKESRLQEFERIWSPELEDKITSYKIAIRDNRGLQFALDTAPSDSD
ncbi:hypothetical protein V5799_025762 [Amblyomma americanum]|uniref:Uncharacterized protein n=1 Tax=Amblyomma americanum TaxID=6943 RepID=A0AAQ4E8J1_AMBAM